MTNFLPTIGILTWLILSLAAPTKAFSYTQIPVTDQEQIDISQFPDYIKVTKDQDHLAHVRKQAFQTHPSHNPSFGWVDDIIWVKIELAKASTTRYILEMGYPLIDHLDIYIFKGRELVRTYRLGDEQDRSDLIDPLKPTVPFPDDAGEYTIYIRMQSSSSLQLLATLYRADRYHAIKKVEFAIFLVYVGAAYLMALYNFLVFISIKSRSYLYYVLFIVPFVLSQISVNGLGQTYLWSTSINDAMTSCTPLLAMTFAFLFTNSILSLSKHSPKQSKTIMSLAAITGFLTLISIFLPYRAAIKMVGAHIILSSGVILYCAIYNALIKKLTVAKLYLLSWAFLLLGTVVYLLKQFGVLPYNFFTHNSILIGNLIEITLLSLALGHRYNAIQNSAREAQRQRAITLNKLKAELQARVHIVSDLAHLTNNPLNHIVTVTRILQNKLKLNQEYGQLFRQVEQACAKIATSIEDIRNLAGVNGNPSEEVSLNEVVEETIVKASEQLNIDVKDLIQIHNSIDSSVKAFINPYAIRIVLVWYLREAANSQNELAEINFYFETQPDNHYGQLVCQTMWKDTSCYIRHSFISEITHLLEPLGNEVTHIKWGSEELVKLKVSTAAQYASALKEAA